MQNHPNTSVLGALRSQCIITRLPILLPEQRSSPRSSALPRWCGHPGSAGAACVDSILRVAAPWMMPKGWRTDKQSQKPTISSSPNKQAYNRFLKACFPPAQQIGFNFSKNWVHPIVPINEIKSQEVISETKWMTVLTKSSGKDINLPVRRM